MLSLYPLGRFGARKAPAPEHSQETICCLLVLRSTPLLMTWQVNGDFVLSVLLTLAVSSRHLNLNNNAKGGTGISML